MGKKTSPSLPCREAFLRLNFLFQASHLIMNVHNSTIDDSIYSHECIRNAAAATATAKDGDGDGDEFDEVNETDDIVKNCIETPRTTVHSTTITTDVVDAVKTPTSMNEDYMIASNESIARFYALTAKTICRRLSSGVRLDASFKRSICRHCHLPLVPGLTSRIRIHSKPETHTVVSCRGCGKFRRYNARRGYTTLSDLTPCENESTSAITSKVQLNSNIQP